jgi:uncharacterized protein YqhQ
MSDTDPSNPLAIIKVTFNDLPNNIKNNFNTLLILLIVILYIYLSILDKCIKRYKEYLCEEYRSV